MTRPSPKIEMTGSVATVTSGGTRPPSIGTRRTSEPPPIAGGPLGEGFGVVGGAGVAGWPSSLGRLEFGAPGPATQAVTDATASTRPESFRIERIWGSPFGRARV